MARPIVIVASSRKGNWMLMSALARHPACFVHSDQWFSRPEFAGMSPHDAVMQLFESPGAAPRIVHSHYPLPYKSRTDNALFYDLLVKKEATFIFLSRLNRVRWYVSLELARRDRAWDTSKPPRETEAAISLNCTEFLKTVNQDEHAYRTAREFIDQRSQWLDVPYESLAASPFEALQSLQRDLDLPKMPLLPTTFKQHDRPLRDLIHNYDEFASDLRVCGSVYADGLE